MTVVEFFDAKIRCINLVVASQSDGGFPLTPRDGDPVRE
jgi:hypothetical protein